MCCCSDLPDCPAPLRTVLLFLKIIWLSTLCGASSEITCETLISFDIWWTAEELLPHSITLFAQLRFVSSHDYGEQRSSESSRPPDCVLRLGLSSQCPRIQLLEEQVIQQIQGMACFTYGNTGWFNLVPSPAWLFLEWWRWHPNTLGGA